MGQDISLKSERKTHDLNHDLTFSEHTINCVCHSIRSLVRVLGIYNFEAHISFLLTVCPTKVGELNIGKKFLDT
jgi:hypothetical protein